MDNVLACIISEGSIAGNVRLDFSAIQIANSVNAIRRVPLHKPANKKPETAPAKIILEVNTATSAKPVTTTTPAVLIATATSRAPRKAFVTRRPDSALAKRVTEATAVTYA
jgi:hypothetical protein